MIVELYSTPEERNRYYDYGADIPFNFGLVRALGNRDQAQRNVCDAVCIRDVIKEEYDTLPKGKWANFVVSALQHVKYARCLISLTFPTRLFYLHPKLKRLEFITSSFYSWGVGGGVVLIIDTYLQIQ